MSGVNAARPRGLARGARVVIAHDYLTQRGGAERVVLAMHRAFPAAPIYTSLFRPDTTFPEFGDADVRPLSLNRLSALRRNHRLALPLLAPAFSSLRVDAAVLLCSSSGWAHATKTDGRKIVYCYTPARWLYQTERYLGRRDLVARLALGALRPALRWWDRRAARTADLYLAQSSVVRDRIRQTYGIEAQMLPAPHAMSADRRQQAVSGVTPGFLLCVSRLLPYKNLDAVIGAFESLPDARLVIVGTGRQAGYLHGLAGSNVTFLESVSDPELAWLYANCFGVIAAAYEDFGLVPLEAAAFGKPTAALRWGGFLDTVIDGLTGLLFDSPSRAGVLGAVQLLLRTQFDAVVLRAHAARYSERRFISSLREIVSAEAVMG